MNELSTFRPPRKEDYFGIVRGLRPFIGEEETELRASLLMMRDRAMATKSAACAPSWALLDVVEQVASECAMNHKLGLEELRELKRLCLHTVGHAFEFDKLFQPRLPGIDGEADAQHG